MTNPYVRLDEIKERVDWLSVTWPELIGADLDGLRSAITALETLLDRHVPDYADLCQCCEYRWPCQTFNIISDVLSGDL